MIFTQVIEGAPGQEPTLQVAYSRAGLRAGADNTIDIVIGIRAPDTLHDGTRGAVIGATDDPDPPPEDFERVLALRATLALDKIDLDISQRSGITIEAPAWLPREDRSWRLPDLAWGAKFHLGLRIHLPAAALPGVGKTKRLGRIRMLAHYVSDWAMLRTATTMDLPVLSAEDHDAVPEDGDVAAFVQQALSEGARVFEYSPDQADGAALGVDATG